MIPAIFNFIGVLILAIVFLVLFILESKFPLRKRVQQRWKIIFINSLVPLTASGAVEIAKQGKNKLAQ